MVQKLKKSLYFYFAAYFRFWARLKLKKWNPRIILITGSSGKSTTLYLIESQLGNKAIYSHYANSSFGIPFHILGLKRKSLMPQEWLKLTFLAPFKAFSKAPRQKLYIVEADCDRPKEGKFITRLIKPEVCLWTSLSKTHSMNFPAPVLKNISFEFGYFIENTSNEVYINSDSKPILSELKRTKSHITKFSLKDLQEYKISQKGTEFKINNKVYSFTYLLPREFYYSLSMTLELLKYLGLKPKSFTNLVLPPGRSSLFQGIRNTTIIDSTYNANLDSMTAVINMYSDIKADKKWLILGDMLEQGTQERLEHLELAKLVLSHKFDHIILLGPRIRKHTYPFLKVLKIPVVSFINPRQVLDYLLQKLEGGETLLFKGARFLEGVIEHLLQDRSQANNLVRREKVWQKRRHQWGL